MRDLFDNPWTRAVGLAISELFPLERGQQIAEFLRRTNQQELIVSIPGHTMHVMVNGRAASVDPDTMEALGNEPTKLNADQVFDLVNGVRKAIGLKPLDRATTVWNPLR